MPTACTAVITQVPGAGLITGSNEVKLTIVSGPRGEVLALVPVYINGQGPFGFALDTGASESVVDTGIVQRLNLPVVGSAGEATGVGGMVSAKLVRVDSWRVGDVNLPQKNIAAINLPGPNTQRGLQGLLGSDVLSNYGEITVNYDRGVLILGPRTSASPSPS
jgi:predicted aspartyl protease